MCRDRKARRQLPLHRIHVELDDGHRGHRRQVMGIQDAQQSIRDFGKLILQLQADPGRQERERFDHALDVGIFRLAGLPIQIQPIGNLRPVAGKLRSQAANVVQLVLILNFERIARHYVDSTLQVPEDGWTTVSKAMDCGSGCIHSNA